MTEFWKFWLGMEDATADEPFLLPFVLVAIGINAYALAVSWSGPFLLPFICALGLTALVPLSVGAMRVKWQTRKEQNFLVGKNHR